MVYQEIMPCVRVLAIDVFANHALQKLLDHGSRNYKRRFVSQLMGNVLSLSFHMYGCRVVQKAFEIGDLDQKVAMAKELRSKVLKCSRDQNASHVVQKCIEHVPARRIQFIFRSFCRKARALSTHTYGCHVIQRALAHCGNPEVYHALMSEIVDAAPRLASDPFGYYVVQHAIEHGGADERSAVVRMFAGRVVSMSYQKHASNVVERCLEFGSRDDRRVVADEILFGAGGGEHFDHVVDMMCHMYATFVIQKMVAMAEEWQLGLLAEVARRNAETLMRYPHGRHVLATINTRVEAGRQVGRPALPAPPPYSQQQ